MSITLKSSTQNSVTSGTTLTVSAQVAVDDFVVLAVVARSALTVPAGYTLLYSENLQGSDYTQTVYLYTKKITTSGTESVTLTQTNAARMYAILHVMENVASASYTGGTMNFSFTSTSTSMSKQISKPQANTACLWAISCVYASTGSTRSYNASPDDMTRTQSDTPSNGVRLVTFFDNGTAAQTHTITYTNQSSNRPYTIDAIVLHEVSTTKYLIEDESQLYTIQNSALVPIAGTLSAALFESDGFDDLTDAGTLLATLTSPTVYAWSENTQPSLLASVTALPYPQDIESNIALVDVTGVDTITATYTGEPLVAVKVDSGNYLIYDDVNETWVSASAHDGMTIADLQDVPAAEWETLLTGANTFGVRVTLSSTVDALNELLFAFLTN